MKGSPNRCTCTGARARGATCTTTRSPGAGRASTSNFHYIPVLSEPTAQCEWRGRTGFVHQAVLEDFPDLSGWGAYLSGPPPMVSAARRTLVAQGLDPTCLHSDSFDYAFETGHDGL